MNALSRLVIASILLPTLAAAQGFPNVSYPQAGVLLSGPNAPTQGRTALMAYLNGVLYSIPEAPSSFGTPANPADVQVRSWDISDPTHPQVTNILGTSRHPISAHGYLFAGDTLLIGDNQATPETSWAFRPTNTFGVNERGAWADQPGGGDGGIGDRGRLYYPFHINMWWSYGAVSGNAVLSRVGGPNHSNQPLASWDHLGDTGVIGHPFIVGNLLIFASEQSQTGIATYDISDPTQPVLLDVLTSGGPGGYWPELWGGDGHLYVVWPYRTFGKGIRVADITDPSDIRWVIDLPLPGDEPMYAQFQDEYAFVANHKINMRTLTSVLDFDSAHAVHTVAGDPYVPSGVGINTSEFALPLGNLLVTGGNGPQQGMAIWVHDTQPDTRGPEVGFHIPRAGQTNYPLNLPITLLIHETLDARTLTNGVNFIVRPVGGAPLDGDLIFAFDDTLTFTPFSPLLPNTTYEVILPAGGIRDAVGNPTSGYSFTFSTGTEITGNHAPEVITFTAVPQVTNPGVSVDLAATASDIDPGDQASLDFRFDAGDGRPKTDWGMTSSASFTYAAPGHYRAVVQARDAAGSIVSSQVTITVVGAIAGAQPTRSGQIAIATNDRAWIVNPDNNSIARLNTGSAQRELEVNVCADPRGVAVDASGNVWVTCHDADRVEVRSGSDGSLLATIDTGYGSAPFGIALSPDGAVAYVSLYGSGRLLRIDVANRTATSGVDLGPTARAVAVTGDGVRVLVTRFISPLNHGEVWDVDAATMTLTRTIELPKLGGLLHQDNTAEGRGVPNYIAGITIAPDNQSAWLVGNKPNVERGTIFGAGLDPQNTVRNLAMRIDLAANEVDRTMDIDNSDSASAVALSPRGDYLFVALQGNKDVVVFDALTLDQSAGLGGIVTRLPVGLAPQGIGIDAASGRIVVSNFLDRNASIFNGAPLFDGGTINLAPSVVATAMSEALPANVLRGKQIFYNAADRRMSSEGYISCATCHVDGGSDGRVWDFTQRGEGLRNTTELRGRAGTAMGNVHWTANFDEIQDFENDIRGGFGGLGFLDDAEFAATQSTLGTPKAGLSQELDDLAAYVTSLGTSSLPRSPHRNADGSLTTTAQAGRDLFMQVGCATCHSGQAFTDSSGPSATLHNVGTLRASSGHRLGAMLMGIDTPTLRGAWANAPYFHNGSAHALSDVFRVAGGTIIEAEAGTVSGGAIQTGANNIMVNFDNSVSGGLAEINYLGSLTFSNVDGGGGGLGAIELRYSLSQGTPSAHVLVNGVDHLIALHATGTRPATSTWAWDTARVEDVLLQPNGGNTIELSLPAGPFAVDHITVSTADDLAAAAAHRGALDLMADDQSELIAFVEQLDGSAVDMPSPQAPVATIVPTAGQSTPVEASFVHFDVAFSRPISGFDASDPVVGGSAGGNVASVIPLDAGTSYRVRVDSLAQAGDVTLRIPAGAVSAQGDGTPNLVSLTRAIDVIPPDDIAPLSDEFDNSATISDWQRNYVTEGWGSSANKLEVWNINNSRSGHMRLVPYSSTWFNDYCGALAYKEITGDFVATIRIDIARRNGQAGRPTSEYTWGGLLVRAPRGLNNAAPSPDPGSNIVLPWPPPAVGAPQHYTTGWQPGTENYIYLASGFATDAINSNTNVWQYEAKSTTASVSNFYSSASGTPAGGQVSTFQIVRRGQTFVLLRRHGDGPWIIETRYVLPNMPATLQVGVTGYTDWAYAGSLNEFHHNRGAAVGVGNPDLVADVDYLRLRRPSADVTEAALQALPLTGQYGALQLLSGTGLSTHLGDAMNTPYEQPTATATPAITATPTPTATATSTATPAAVNPCPHEPRGDCDGASSAKVSLRGGTPARRGITWRWEGTGQTDPFADVVVDGEAIGICSYVNDVLSATAIVPTGGTCGSRPCWSSVGSTAFKFRGDGSAGGIVKLQIAARGASLRLSVKGKGASLASPLPMAGDATLRLQLTRPNGSCWESEFSPLQARNRGDRYQASVR